MRGPVDEHPALSRRVRHVGDLQLGWPGAAEKPTERPSLTGRTTWPRQKPPVRGRRTARRRAYRSEHAHQVIPALALGANEVARRHADSRAAMVPRRRARGVPEARRPGRPESLAVALNDEGTDAIVRPRLDGIGAGPSQKQLGDVGVVDEALGRSSTELSPSRLAVIAIAAASEPRQVLLIPIAPDPLAVTERRQAARPSTRRCRKVRSE